LPFWRREDDEPAHERLAREAGIDLEGAGAPPFADPGPEEEEPLEPHLRIPFLEAFREVGVHGLHRQRRWDVIVAADAADLPGDTIDFVTLPDGTVLVDEDLPEGALTPLAEALEQELEPPYQATAIRREDGIWGIGANQIEVVEVPEEIPGDSVSLAVQDGERTLMIDDRPGWADVPTLERLARERQGEYALRADRLDGNLWSVKVNPL
jgi:hypothetical protein